MTIKIFKLLKASSVVVNCEIIKEIKMSSIDGRRIIALDCEMVGGVDNSNILARVSIVDYFGNIILDSFVSSLKQIGDYRTIYSGIRPNNLIDAPSFSTIQNKVREIIFNKILVGHSLHMDLNVLELEHPIQYRRDIGKNNFIITKYGNSMRQSVSLQRLTLTIFNRHIQVNEHDSIEDAVAALNIYKFHKNDIEYELNGFAISRSLNESDSETEETQEAQVNGLSSNVVIAAAVVGSAIALFNMFRNRRNE